MKKLVSVLLSICMLLSLTLTACAAEETPNENGTTIILKIGSPAMSVNGKDMPIDEQGTVPVIVNDRTLLPIRAVVEQMGGTVDCNGDTKEVTLSYGDDEIKLTIDSADAYLNGEKQTLDAAPTVINDRTMLPIRFIAESFKFNVEWNASEQTITITKSKTNEEATVKQPEEKQETQNSTSKSLVVYFSATGNTKSLAEKIAEESGSDIFEIVPEEPYTSEDLNYSNSNCRANKEQNDPTARPAISNKIENIDDYDVILIGYPIWWGTMPKIINTFLDTYDLSGKAIMPFCTSGSSGISTSVSAIRNICTNSTVTDGFRGTSSTTDTQIRTWLNNNNFSEAIHMRMKLTANGKEIIIKLNNNETAKDLAATLPCELDFSDFGGSEKIAYPTKTLNTVGISSGTQPNAGDLTLYKPWGNLALFYKDYSYSSDLIPLGSIEKGTENISMLDGKVESELL